MDVEKALIILDSILNLTNLEEKIIKGSWEFKSYEAIAKDLGYSPEHVKNTGAKLWGKIYVSTGIHVSKTNCQVAIRKIHRLTSPNGDS